VRNGRYFGEGVGSRVDFIVVLLSLSVWISSRVGKQDGLIEFASFIGLFKYFGISGTSIFSNGNETSNSGCF